VRVVARARRHPAHHRDAHGNPEDLEACLGRLLDPGRARWQKPGAVVRALRLRPGQTVGEIGAGPGFFTFRLARAVGPRGRVYAVDAEPRMLERLVARLPRSRVWNVTPVLGRDDDPLLPARCCDLILVVNTYHHFPDGRAFLRRLVRSLRPGGRLANVDFHDRETPVGPPLEHRVPREAFLRDAGRAGLRLAGEADFLPYQYFLILEPRRTDGRDAQ
jgi:ubiquinone/menaquinone biosynthesis C-methylase UbiE